MKDTTLEGRAKTKNGVTRLVFSAGSDIYFAAVYRTQSLCRGDQPVYESIGADRYFEYVCISSHFDDQNAMDFSHHGISDHGTHPVPDGWSEWRYE